MQQNSINNLNINLKSRNLPMLDETRFLDIFPNPLCSQALNRQMKKKLTQLPARDSNRASNHFPQDNHTSPTNSKASATVRLMWSVKNLTWEGHFSKTSRSL